MKEEKKCKTCGKKKALSEFDKNKTSLFGVRPDCKICRGKERKRKYREDEEFRRKESERRMILYHAQKSPGNWWDIEKGIKSVNI